MSRLRSQLRRAARDFADTLYETLRADLARELRRELPARSRSRPLPPRTTRPQRTTALRAEAFERVLMYVTEHPGTKPKAIIDETGLRRPVVFQALAHGCELGALTKTGEWRNVTYAPACAEATSSEPRRKFQRSRIRAADVRAQVVAWIADHPGVTRGELQAAFDVTPGVLRAALELARNAGVLRMEGTRGRARYFATNGSATSSTMTSHDLETASRE